MAGVPTVVTASQSVVDQCGLYSVDVIPMQTSAASHNLAAAFMSAMSGSSIRFTIHTRVVDPDKLQAARAQQQQRRAAALAATTTSGPTSPTLSARATTNNSTSTSTSRKPTQRSMADATTDRAANSNGMNAFDDHDDALCMTDVRSSASSTPTPQAERENNEKADEGAASPAQRGGGSNEALPPPSPSVTVVKESHFYDEEEITITQNALVTYSVVRSLEHFVWFQRQLSEKEPFLLFGELPTSLAAAYADPLKTSNQITAMIMFFVRSKTTASDPFLWSLLTAPDDDFQQQYLSLVGSHDAEEGEGGATPELIAATDFIATTQENISGLQSGASSIAPLRWNFSIGNSWSAGSPFAALEGGGDSGAPLDEEGPSTQQHAHVRRLECLLNIVDQDEYPADVIKRTRDKVARAGLAPLKTPTQARFEREQRQKAVRQRKTAQLLHHINERLTLPEEDIKPEQISKGMIESGMVDRAFFSCDKLSMTTASANHFQKELVRHDALFYAWGDALDAAYRLKVAMEDLAEAQEALAPALRDLCETNYWPWTKEKVFEEELKPKLSPRVHTSHRLTHHAHRIANLHVEVSRIEKNFVSDGLISAITLGAMLYSGHRWSCAVAHQRVHRGNKIDPAVRHAALGLDQYARESSVVAAPGVTVTNTYVVNEMKKALMGVSPIFVQAVRTSLTPTAPATGRGILALQRDLKTIFELGRGVSEADMLDQIDDDTSEIQDRLDAIIDTFQGHFKEVRHDALYANVAQYLKELAVFLKLSWVSAGLAIKEAHKTIDEDLFTDLEKEDLTFVMQRRSDPKEKYKIPAGFRVKDNESASTMIQQFRLALEKSRAAVSSANLRISLGMSGGDDISTAAATSSSLMIRDHVSKQSGGGGRVSQKQKTITATASAGKGFMAPTLHNPFDMAPPPISPFSASDSAFGEEMVETSEEEMKQRAFLQQMAELQMRQKTQQLQIEASREKGLPNVAPSISTLTSEQLPPLNLSPLPTSAKKTPSGTQPIPISKLDAPKSSIFASSDDTYNLNGAATTETPPAGSIGSAGAKKRRFGKSQMDKDDPFA